MSGYIGLMFMAFHLSYSASRIICVTSQLKGTHHPHRIRSLSFKLELVVIWYIYLIIFFKNASHTYRTFPVWSSYNISKLINAWNFRSTGNVPYFNFILEARTPGLVGTINKIHVRVGIQYTESTVRLVVIYCFVTILNVKILRI